MPRTLPARRFRPAPIDPDGPEVIAKAGGAPATYGGGYGGGSYWLNPFRGRRQLTLVELVEAFQSIVYSCSNLNAGAVARVPLRLYVRTGAGQKRPKCRTKALAAHERLRLQTKAAAAIAGAEDVEEVTEHPLLDMLDNPCPGFDRRSLLLLWSYYLDILGHFLAKPEAARAGVVLCWPLQSQYALPVRSAGRAVIESFTYFGERYAPEELVWGRFISPRDPYGFGYGPTQAAAEFIGLHGKYIGVQDNLLSSGMKPSAILAPRDESSNPGEAEGRRAAADLNAGFAGDRAGRVLYIPWGLELQPWSLPPGDLGSLNIADNAIQRIANIFGVPISMLTSDTNLANLEAAARQHAETAVEPRCHILAGALTAWTRTQGRTNGLGWERLFWQFDDPSQENRESIAQVFQIEASTGATTINEYRAERGLPPVPWGDEPWLPSSVSQPSNRPDPNALPPGPTAPGDDEPDEPTDETKVLDEALATLKAIQKNLSGGRWVTLENGEHAYISGSEIVAGAGRGSGTGKKPEGGNKPGSTSSKKPEAKKPEASNKPTPAAPKTEGRDFGAKPAKEIREHHQAMSADWRKSLSEDEHFAVRTYTGASYEPINKELRTAKPKDNPSPLVRTLDGALDRSRLKEDTVVYRGISDLSKLGLDDKTVVGATVRDKAFTSTSLDRKVAEKYAGKGGAVLKITAPKGSKGASMGKISRYDKESEILFARNSGFRVTHTTKEGGRLIVHAELVQ